ncbi:retrovirus-related pol polyprotein from transposon TNT 1-94 [Tanacetum coccineum]
MTWSRKSGEKSKQRPSTRRKSYRSIPAKENCLMLNVIMPLKLSHAANDEVLQTLWHKRLGHMSEKEMSILFEKNVLSGVHDINLEKCSHTVKAGKANRLLLSQSMEFSSKDLTEYTTVKCLESRKNRIVETSDASFIMQGCACFLFGNDEEHDEEQGADDVDAQEQPNLDEDVHPELPVPDMPQFLPLRWYTRDHHPSIRYSAHEYVLLTDGGEPEC